MAVTQTFNGFSGMEEISLFVSKVGTASLNPSGSRFNATSHRSFTCRQHFFRYKVAKSKSELSEDLETTKPSKTANAAHSQSDNASKAGSAKAKSPKAKSPKSKSSTKKKLRGVAAGVWMSKACL